MRTPQPLTDTAPTPRFTVSIGVHAAVAAVLAVTVVLLGLTAVTSSASASTMSTSSYAARLTDLVNKARAAHGLHSLTVASGTTAVAAKWTAVLADNGSLSHNPDLASQLEHHGSADWHLLEENVGVGSPDDADGLFKAYMNSPEHRSNILDSNVRYIGDAVVFSGGRAWNTMDFVDEYSSSSSTTTTTKHHATTKSAPKPAPKPTAPAPKHTAAPAPKPVATHAPVHHAAKPVKPAKEHKAAHNGAHKKAKPAHPTHPAHPAQPAAPAAIHGSSDTAALSAASVTPTSGTPMRAGVVAVAAALLLFLGYAQIGTMIRTRRTAIR